MIQSFSDRGTEDLFNGVNFSHARRTCPRILWALVARKLDLLDSAEHLEDLKVPPENRLEALVGDWRGLHSIRINKQYRICFRWNEDYPSEVEIVDYHR